MFSPAQLESLHRYCTGNRDQLQHCPRAGCFYCCAIFSSTEIRDWVDGRQVETGDTADGITALCPRCGIDAVLPEGEGLVLSPEVLSEMHAYWF